MLSILVKINNFIINIIEVPWAMIKGVLKNDFDHI
jgi:hypothetical protein